MGIICGSGLKSLGARLHGAVEIPFSDIPYLPSTTVPGHGSSLLVGFMGEVVTAVYTGRIHFYEGHSLQTVIFPTRILVEMGISSLLVTNAAGALDSSYQTGDIMVFDDHISFLNLAGLNPLRGANLDTFGPRFPSVTNSYHKKSFEFVYSSAYEAGCDMSIVRRGVYVMVGGPSYETKAEVKFLAMIGGSAVGMSTVPEVVCAAHSGINVVAMSLITNSNVGPPILGADGSDVGPSHEEILEIANKRQNELENLVSILVPKMADLPSKDSCSFCSSRMENKISEEA